MDYTISVQRDLDILQKREEFYNLLIYGTVIKNSSVFLADSANLEIQNILSFQNSNNKIKQFLAGICYSNNMEYLPNFEEMLKSISKKRKKR